MSKHALRGAGRRALALRALVPLALAACSLDSSGAISGAGGAGTGPAASTTTAAVSSSDAASSGGDGGGASTASTTSGQGAGGNGVGGHGGHGGHGVGGSGAGGAGTGGRGGAGAGGGGASAASTGGGGGSATSTASTGGGGGGGGGPPEEERFYQVGGSDTQVVLDVAIDPTGEFIYAVGYIKGTASIVGTAASAVASGEDAFVAKLRADGSGVSWMVGFGGAGNERANAVAVSAAGRVFVAGNANGRAVDSADLFAPGLENAPDDAFGWLVEIDPASGSRIVGVPWGPVDAIAGIDVTVTDARAVAVGTCDDCSGGAGRDVVLVGIDLASAGSRVALISAEGDQAGQGIDAIPGDDAFILGGQIAASAYDPAFDGEAGCALGAGSGADVLVARYNFDSGAGNYSCAWSDRLTSSGNDLMHSLVVDAAGTAYVGARFPEIPSFGTQTGVHVVAVDDMGVVWEEALDPDGTASTVRGLASDGVDLVAGGFLDASNDGYLKRLSMANGAVVATRTLIGSGSATNTSSVATRNGLWVAGGDYNGTVDFGGGIGSQAFTTIDGFVLKFLEP